MSFKIIKYQYRHQNAIETSNLRREFSQLVANHILDNPHIVVDLPIVHLEHQSNEVRQDRCAPRAGLDRRDSFACFWTDDREAI